MFIISLICIAIALFSVYVSSVLIVSAITHKDAKTSKGIVNKFLRTMIQADPVYIYYPVYIGIDEYGMPHSDIIMAEFSALKRIFETVFFHCYFPMQNRLLYQFRVSYPQKQMDEYSLILYCNSVCEEIVHNFVQKHDYSFGEIYHLVSTDIQDGILSVYIATNIEGSKENSEHKEIVRKRYEKLSIQSSSIEKNWSDET